MVLKPMKQSSISRLQSRTFSLCTLNLGIFTRAECSCTTRLFLYPSLWGWGWVWKAWLTSVRALGDTRVLYATCQRLNDGSQSTPPQLHLTQCECAWTVSVGSRVCVFVWESGGVIIHLNVPLCVFLRSRVNYIGHDVKGRSLVGENTGSSMQQLPWRQHC